MSKFDLIAVTGEYTNAAGETKKRFARVGSMWDKGQNLSIKIDNVPVGNWDGWLMVKPAEERQQQQQQQPKRQQYQGLPADDGDIPF